MTKLRYMIARNCKLFFKDKGVCCTALIAPLILLFLFVAFLGDVYRDSLVSVLDGIVLADELVEGFAGGWLLSSLISVCAVTIAFTANLIMVQDRATGRISDLKATPVSQSTLALSYYISTVIVTLGICCVALAAGLCYIAAVGWYLSAADVLLAFADTFLLVLFGTALSSVVCYFLKSQGGITAVEATVSAAYGFLCGAYMPISSLAEGLAKVLSFLPGTYGTGLLHEHLMGGVIDEIGAATSMEYASAIRDGFDCTLYFFSNAVPAWTSYLVLAIAIAALVALYVLLCSLRKKVKTNFGKGVAKSNEV